MRIEIYFAAIVIAVGSACAAEHKVLHARVDGTPNYGERVSIHLCITNSTSTNIVIPYEGVLSIFSISVKDSAGRDVKLTALGGRELIGAAMPRGRRTRVIAPRQQYCVSLDLNLLYDMSLPDNYSVKVGTSYSLVGKGKAEHIKIDPIVIPIVYLDPKDKVDSQVKDVPLSAPVGNRGVSGAASENSHSTDAEELDQSR